jgi:hypothetical protein
MAGLNLGWDMKVYQLSLTVLSKNHSFACPQAAVPEIYNRFQPNSAW